MAVDEDRLGISADFLKLHLLELFKISKLLIQFVDFLLFQLLDPFSSGYQHFSFVCAV
jgi:hypothetical protein